MLRKYYPHGTQSMLHIVYRVRNWNTKRPALVGGVGKNTDWESEVPSLTLFSKVHLLASRYFLAISRKTHVA